LVSHFVTVVHSLAFIFPSQHSHYYALAPPLDERRPDTMATQVRLDERRPDINRRRLLSFAVPVVKLLATQLPRVEWISD
jgi:hypothetical protein